MQELVQVRRQIERVWPHDPPPALALAPWVWSWARPRRSSRCNAALSWRQGATNDEQTGRTR